MPDNLGYTQGTGAEVATREVTYSGEVAHAQAVGLVTLTGPDDAKVATDVSATAPLPVDFLGESIQAIESMRMAIQALTRTIGLMQPDTAARMRVALDAISAGLTLATVSTVTTVTTVSTMTNQTQMGGLSATEQIPSLMRLGADSLRRNVSTS